MGWAKSAAAVISICALGAQPCVAATDYRQFNASQSTTSAFVGLNVRMPLGAAKKAQPTARLQLTSAFNLRDASTGGTQTFKGHGLEIGGTRSGRPALYLNGQSTAEMKAKLRMSGTTTALLVGGVLVVLAVVVAAAAGSGAGDTCPEFEGSRAHCINP